MHDLKFRSICSTYDKSSNSQDVISSVPQSSVLDPILFVIYVNDIDEGLTCKISKFADD